MYAAYPCVAQYPARSVEYTVFAGNILPRLGTFADLAALLLRQTRHQRKPQLTVIVSDGVNVVIDEINLNTFFLEFTHIVEGFHRISRKAAYFSGHDHVDLSGHCILYQPEKVRALFGLRTRNTTIQIRGH